MQCTTGIADNGRAKLDFAVADERSWPEFFDALVRMVVSVPGSGLALLRCNLRVAFVGMNAAHIPWSYLWASSRLWLEEHWRAKRPTLYDKAGISGLASLSY
jgi:hypothetical protein